MTLLLSCYLDANSSLDGSVPHVINTVPYNCVDLANSMMHLGVNVCRATA